MTMRQLIYFILMYIPINVCSQTASNLHGQPDQGNLNWIRGLSWNQVKQKALNENKFVFIDAYATWCGPCKAMNKTVFVNDTIERYFNEKFVCLKVQMDKTKSDDDYIKSWYSEAELIKKEFKINSYPTFIFISPEGKVVHKEFGYKSVIEFMAIANSAIQPGKIYDDPYAEYDSLVMEYNRGIRDFDQIPYMVKVALKLKESAFALQLVKEHTDYIMTLNKKDRYTKENIEMWNAFAIGSNTRIFQFFLKDGNWVDKVMHKKGYAKTVVDKVIKNEIVIPFFNEQAPNKKIRFTGMYLSGKGVQVDSSEADWSKLKKLVASQYSRNYTKRNVLAAKVEWYKRLRNYSCYTRSALNYLKKSGRQISHGNSTINSYAWDTFKYSTDKTVIDGFIKLMSKIVIEKSNILINCNHLDTYANLLYKAGKVEDAIFWEKKAIDAAIGGNSGKKGQYLKIIEQMKNGEPTWGASWGYK